MPHQPKTIHNRSHKKKPMSVNSFSAASRCPQAYLDIEDEDEEEDLVIQQLLYPDPHAVAQRRGGSRPGKRANKNRDFQTRYQRFVEQYFAPIPVYDDDDFRIRNRMSKTMFYRVLNGVLDADSAYFEQRPNAAKKMGIHPLMKMSKTAIYNNVCHFVDAVDKQFGDEYLRSPTESDMKRLLELRGVDLSECGAASTACTGSGKTARPVGLGCLKARRKNLRLFWRRAQIRSFGFGTLALAGLER
ncbi:uncharacterized protein PITG_02072 [Phytophthora infestans T30-4]|uniref:Uncharacterized protein n=1 Tax=Phytophthora infestans (strain T30-4) TaxID=403677 RepID=D0MVE4_PHYIT|nr:uncharacterized protein PITG_02072 [Phytophthora infestans T30-4]EEY63607.1 conserved hypothetical protein [Phytophthora infestans T30-4]|eukprot:XP_002907043.1 conserved hypothetical protein [Phytophthora infestans T30-4]